MARGADPVGDQHPVRVLLPSERSAVLLACGAGGGRLDRFHGPVRRISTGFRDIRIYAAASPRLLVCSSASPLRSSACARPMPCASGRGRSRGVGLELLVGSTNHTLAASISFSIVFRACRRRPGLGVLFSAQHRGAPHAIAVLSGLLVRGSDWASARSAGGLGPAYPLCAAMFLAAIMAVLMWRLAPVSSARSCQ